MTLRIVADENIPGIEPLLSGAADIVRLNGRSLQRPQLEGADALLVRSVTRVDRALLEGSGIRFVGTATAGTDHIDKAWLQQAGIAFCSAPGANANSVVEYVLAAIAESEGVLEALLDGGRVGIIGYGHVGRSLAARLSRLGIDWCASDPWLEPQDIACPASLHDVLRCDVVAVHAELTRREPWPSYHLLGAGELAQLSEQQLLINASRGSVVDNTALRQRLETTNAPAVVLDVWEGEPAVDPALLARVQFGTAHIAGYSLDGKLVATRMLAAALLEALEIAPLAAGAQARSPLELTLHADGQDRAGFIRGLIGQVYSVAQDDALLRAAVQDETPAIAANFDRLRRNYRERRELKGARVRLAPESDLARQVIEGMGATCI